MSAGITTSTSIRDESDTFLQKIHQASEQSDWRFTFQIDVLERSTVTGCPAQQPGGSRKGWTGGKFGQATHGRGPAKAYLPAEHADTSILDTLHLDNRIQVAARAFRARIS